jgi:hypothetical protein
MGFNDEDELEQWYSEEKEKLDATFMAEMVGKEDTSAEKKRYTAALKKLIARYQSECGKLLSRASNKKK